MGLMNTMGAGFQWLANRFGKGNFNYNNYRIGYKGEILLDTSCPAELYYQIPELQIVDNKFADLFSNGYVVLEDAEGKIIPEAKAKEFYKLFNNPNPLQSGNAFLREYALQFCIFGNQLIYKNYSSIVNKLPVSLTNIPADYINPILTGKYLDQVAKEEIVSGFVSRINGVEKYYKTQQVIWTKNPDVENPIVGKSAYYGLKFPISNTRLAYKFRNVIMAAEGIGMGMISGASGGQGGALPLKASEVKRLTEERKRSTGIDKENTLTIVEGNAAFTAFPTDHPGLFTEVDANFKVICNLRGLDTNLFFNNGSYENKKNGMIASYQDAIIPFADAFGQLMTDELQTLKHFGGSVKVRYDHVQVLKEDNTREVANLKTQTDTLIIQINAGLISVQAAQNIIATQLGVPVEQLKESGNETLKALMKMSPLVANKALDTLTLNEIRAMVGVKPIDNGDIPIGQIVPPSNLPPVN